MVEPVCQDCNRLVAEKQDLRFDHQIKHLLGVIDRSQKSIDESVAIIARNDQQSETLRENIKAYRTFIEDTRAAIRVLEDSDGG